MPERPLLRLPDPNDISAPPGHGGGSELRLPPRQRQKDKFGPTFGRLRTTLNNGVELRSDPTSLAPERVIVFEYAGTIVNLQKAAAHIPGLEFIGEYESDFDADEDFAVVDERKGREGQDRTDKPVPSRLYLAMPDMRAFQELLRLWDRWERDEPLGRGFSPFEHLFKQLHDVRPWGPQDRISEDTIEFWREEIRRNPGGPVRAEVELWYRESEERRRAVFQNLSRVVASMGGRVLQHAVIGEIAYDGALIDIPAAEAQRLIEHEAIGLAVVDDVLFLRPQSVLLDRKEAEAELDIGIESRRNEPTAAGLPIAALLDGMPVQLHELLAGRLRLDDPDDLESRALVSGRLHGTAMASLILHGDLNEAGPALSRPLYVRPLMVSDAQGQERTETDRLLVDTFYRAILRIKGSEGEEAAAPNVFLINISLGDPGRPFAGFVSPLARLLDFLAVRYNILFLVSGGNVLAPLDIPDFDGWRAFSEAAPDERERAVIKGLNNVKRVRTILSPAESLNALTIGGQHHDSMATRHGGIHAVDPFADNTLPNVSSGLGLGYRRMIKPELYFPGGREHVRMLSSGDGLTVRVNGAQRLYGLKAAAPDSLGQGRLNCTSFSDGTSSATALATRAAHRIFDTMMDRDSGSRLADMDPQYYAVAVKCLLAHSARWTANHELLKEICGPANRRQHTERAENASRFIGFGVPDIVKALECAANRATLVGYGAIPIESGHDYRIPLPVCLQSVREPRTLTVTLAWFSPIKPSHQSYRCVRLEAAPKKGRDGPVEMLGVVRWDGQPADAAVKRGGIFHEHFHGRKAVPFIDDGHLALQVWRKEDGDANEGDVVRYAIAVTIEAENSLPIYEQIEQRLRIRPRV